MRSSVEKTNPPRNVSGVYSSTDEGGWQAGSEICLDRVAGAAPWLVLFYIFRFRLRRNEFMHLVLNSYCISSKVVFIFFEMVPTKEKVSLMKKDPYIRLGTAAVAAVGSSQGVKRD